MQSRAARIAGVLAIGVVGCGLQHDGQGGLPTGQRSTVAFESIDGPPPAVFDRLVRKLNQEAEARQVPVVTREGFAPYRIRGYVAVGRAARPDRGVLGLGCLRFAGRPNHAAERRRKGRHAPAAMPGPPSTTRCWHGWPAAAWSSFRSISAIPEADRRRQSGRRGAAATPSWPAATISGPKSYGITRRSQEGAASAAAKLQTRLPQARVPRRHGRAGRIGVRRLAENPAGQRNTANLRRPGRACISRAPT